MKNNDLAEAIQKAKNALVVLWITEMKYLESLEKLEDAKDKSLTEFFVETVKSTPIRNNALKGIDNFAKCLSEVNDFFKMQ